MTKTVVVIQARMGSTRLPGKVLRLVCGQSLLSRVVARAALIGADDVVVATSDTLSDDEVAAHCQAIGVMCSRGSESDVLDRFHSVALARSAEHIIRVTADCPFVCFNEGRRVLERHLERAADYTHNVTVWGSGMPLGTGVEVFTAECLAASWRDGHAPHHREHVDEYAYEHPERFRIERVEAPPMLRRPHLRLTIDERPDLELVTEVQRRLGAERILPLIEVVELLDSDPILASMNANVTQKRT